MGDKYDISGLQNLHRDLLALSESRLPNLERLWVELEDQLEELKKFLDKTPKNAKHRQMVSSGKIQIDGVDYSINEELKEGTLQLADTLNIDEIEAASMFMIAWEEAETLDRSELETSIIRFHERRQYVLECVRLVMKLDKDVEEEIRDNFARVVRHIESKTDGGGPAFYNSCLLSMADIRRWLQELAEKTQTASIRGQDQLPELTETIELQRVSLTRQHESLGAILSYLAYRRHSSVDNFKSLLSAFKGFNKYDNLLVHYIPGLISFVLQFGSAENSESREETRTLCQHIIDEKENDPWALRYFQAAVSAWWFGEYSGWYPEGSMITSLNGPSTEEETEAELPSRKFLEALKDGALDFILSVIADVRASDWLDPAKQGLRGWLQRKSPVIASDPTPFSPYFQLLVMEDLESFVDAVITNMPDTLRRLKIDEEEQRSLRRTPENDLDLEKFLLIMSYVYEDRPEAAMSFWTDPDSNLFGFLQWASSRQITPLASVYSELIRTLAKGEECATAAHEFLLEEGPTATGKLRRSQSFCWDQIFSELQYYSSKIRDRPALTQSTVYRTGRPSTEEAELEPEVAVMLEGYLRLIARLCTECPPARSWLFGHSTFHLVELLFLFCSSAIPSRLRACAFGTLEALLKDKSPQVGDYIWQYLDQWVSGGLAPSSDLSMVPNPPNAPVWAEEVIFEAIATDFEESNAFVQLLQALVAPYVNESGLNDALPFPEYLGSAYRMPGIEPHIDFVLGRVFGMKTAELQDLSQLRILRHTCLEFITTCLSTFNEDLLIFANGSNVSVDAAIGTSSLELYVRLHPFSRVMEWLFNEKVLTALFSAAHQDIVEVSNSSPDSPLMLGLLRSIETMSLLMKMQFTYLDIVRPIIKSNSPNRRPPVSNTALASFEDSVLNNLQLVVDLGLYCGTGHQELVILSLRLLEQVSTARRLVSAPISAFGQRLGRNYIIGALEMNGESDRIAKSLVSEMHFTGAELDQGPDSPAFAIKASILEFLNSCLAALPRKPTVAHLLLGFSVTGDTIDVAHGGPFAKDMALFHSILKILYEYPDGEIDGNFLAWLMHLKQAGLQLLEKLWKSPLSSVYTMTELRVHEFLFVQFVRQTIVNSSTLWDGRSIADPDFIFSESAICFRGFLIQRAALLDYATREICYIAQEHAPTWKARILSTLLGTTSTSDGGQVSNPTVFDLFDFIELDIPSEVPEATSPPFAEIDLSICTKAVANEITLYDLPSVEELLTLKQHELRKGGHIPGPAEEQSLHNEAQKLVARLHARNQRNLLLQARSDTLKAWTQLLLMVLENCDFDLGTKTAFIFQTFQVILPKLEQYSLESITEALELSRLAKVLLSNLDFISSSFDKGRAGDVANDRLCQLFRISLRGIHSPIATTSLRENFYSICYRYLTGMSDVSEAGTISQRHHTQTIKASGERLIEVICDDAYAGDEVCRISAFLLLDALVSSDEREDSNYMVEALVRLNFIAVVVDAIRHIPSELRDTKAQDVPLLFSYYEAKLSLLLRISQTRAGATYVLNAGLFQSVRDSQLFSVDPDLGLDIDHPEALKKYYNLLLAVIRVINSAVLSKGSQNQHTIDQARRFLADNRYQIVAIFKRHAKIGGVHTDASGDLENIVESFTLLISMTKFLEAS